MGFDVASVNPLGPVHMNVEPEVDVTLRVSVLPAQRGLLLVITGREGVGFITDVVVAGDEVQSATFTVTVYEPDAALVAFKIVGFCTILEKPFGPVQL